MLPEKVVIKYYSATSKYPKYIEVGNPGKRTATDIKTELSTHLSVASSALSLYTISEGTRKEWSNDEVLTTKGSEEIEVVEKEFPRQEAEKTLTCHKKYFAKLGIMRGSSQTNFESSMAMTVGTHKDILEKWNELIKRISEGNLENFKKLAEKLAKETDLNKKMMNGWNCLHYSSYYGRGAINNILLAEYHLNANSISDDAWTPLHLACAHGHMEAAKQLIVVGKADINLSIGVRGTPLHCAALNGKLQMAIYLLCNKAEVNLVNSLGKTPLNVSTNEKITDLLKRATEHVGSAKPTIKPKLQAIIDKPMFVPPRPPQICGWLNEKLPNGETERKFYSLNAVEGTLKIYNSQEDSASPYLDRYLLWNLKNIKIKLGASPIIWEFTHVDRHEFYCKSKIAAMQWTDYLFRAGEYNEYYRNLTHLATDSTQPPEKKAIYEQTLTDISSSWIFEIFIDDNTGAESPVESSPTKLYKKSYDKREDEKVEKKEELMKPPPLDNESIMLAAFEPLDKIGSGSFGQILKVRHKETNEIYAMKIFSKSFLIKSMQMKYALAECQVLKNISHPFLLKLRSAFQTKQNLYLVLDLCPGGDLGVQLAQRSIFEEQEAKLYIAEVILAIEYLHSKNIIYRDMKPDNILIGPDGHIKLADFGLAKELDQDATLSQTFCGTPAYLSPEMISKKGSGKEADIYGMGAVLYEMLVGLPPFFDRDIKVLYNKIKFEKIETPLYITSEAKKVLKAMLAKNPSQRPTIAELKKHAFFSNIDWAKLEKKEIPPPIPITDIIGKESSEEADFLKKADVHPKPKPLAIDDSPEGPDVYRAKDFFFEEKKAD